MSKRNGHLGVVVQRLRRAALVKDAAHLPDRELLQRYVQARDETAFAVLVRRHGPMVLGLCGRVLRHHQDAEDAFQAAFLVLARKASNVRKSESLASWLHSVAYRAASKLRAARARHFAQLDASIDVPERIPSAEPELKREIDRLRLELEQARLLLKVVNEEILRLRAGRKYVDPTRKASEPAQSAGPTRTTSEPAPKTGPPGLRPQSMSPDQGHVERAD